MGKVTIREAMSNAVDEMREEGASELKLTGLQASEATIKNYLWDLRLPQETLSYKIDKNGTYAIYRDANARQGMNKHDVLNRLRDMRHEEIWHIQGEDLQIDIKYCSNIIAAASQDGLQKAKYLKAVFPGFIVVLCLKFYEAGQEDSDRYDDEFEVTAQMQKETTTQAQGVSVDPAAPLKVPEDEDIDWLNDGVEDDDDDDLI